MKIARSVQGVLAVEDEAVADGWLTLKGEVQHQYENDAAFDAVCRLPGVGGITNEIKVITAGIAG